MGHFVEGGKTSIAEQEPQEAILTLQELVKVSEKEVSGANLNRLLVSVQKLADEASSKFDRLTKLFLAGIAAANATGLSVTLGITHGDLNTESPFLFLRYRSLPVSPLPCLIPSSAWAERGRRSTTY